LHTKTNIAKNKDENSNIECLLFKKFYTCQQCVPNCISTWGLDNHGFMHLEAVL